MVIEIEAWPSASLTTFGCTPGLEQQGGAGVPQIVEPDVAEPDCVRALAESVGHRQQKHRHSATPVEYVSLVDPGRRTQATLGLRSPMGAKVLRDELRHRDRPPTARRLGLGPAALVDRGEEADAAVFEVDVLPADRERSLRAVVRTRRTGLSGLPRSSSEPQPGSLSSPLRSGYATPSDLV